MQTSGGLQREFVVTVEETVASARWLEGIAAANAIPDAIVYAMQLCLEELLGNVLRHGGASRRAKVGLTLKSNQVQMTVEDDGPPFDVASAPVKHVSGKLEDVVPGGLGIGLIHDFSSGLQYARAGLGNRVTVTFDLANTAPSADPKLAGPDTGKTMRDAGQGILASPEFQDLIALSRVEFLRNGDTLLKQGEVTDAAYYLASGEVAVIAETAYGAVRLATLKAPRLIGEVGVFADLPRTASIVADGAAVAHRIQRDRILEFGRNNPALLLSIIAQLGRQLDSVNRTIGLYTNALSAMEKQEFDPALLEDLKNPPPQLADFAAVFRRFAGEIQSKRRQEEELASAAIIQQSFLPRPQRLAEVADRLDVAASIRAARQVGGDFYDYLHLPGDRFAFAVGDICGKGMPAALFTASVVTILRASARKEKTVAKVLARTNKLICRDNPAALFATVFYGVIDLATGRIYYGNCGHNAPLILRRDGTTVRLPATGVPIGMFDGMSAKEGEVTLEPGDLLFAYSDGVTEATDLQRHEYGEERLAAYLNASPGQTADAIVSGVMADVDAFAGAADQADDITCLALRRPLI